MSEFTHARCGGVLVEIPAPEWAPKFVMPHGATGTTAEYARCGRCNLPGELARGPEENDPPEMAEGSLQVSQ